MDQLPRLGKRELICLLLFTCNYVVSVWRGFLFLWVLGMGHVILLWHSLSLPYNYFGREQAEIFHSNRMLKATKKSISLPQSKCPLIKTIDCIIQSLGAVEVEWFLFYAPTIA